MNPLIPSPDPLPLPGPASLFAVLLHLTLLVHLLFMNALFGGLVLALINVCRRREPGDVHDRLAASVSKLIPTLFAGTVTFGVAPLLFMQVLYGDFFYTSSIIIAWPWLAVVGMLIVAYYTVYLNAFRKGWRRGGRLTVLAIATILIAATAFVFSNNLTLMLRPERWGELYFARPGGGSLNLGEITLWPRYLHMALGAVAVAGALLAVWSRTRRGDPELYFLALRQGTAVCGWTTMANVMIGLWFLFALPRPIRMLTMGDSIYATALFGVGFLLSLVMIAIAMRMNATDVARSPAPLAIVTLVMVAAMILLRDVVRGGYLADHLAATALPVSNQSLNLAIFGVLLAAGAATLVWLIRSLLGSRQG